MIDFIEYVVGELKSKRLSKGHALSLINQFSGRASAAGTAALHPLLHRNTSDLAQQSYASSFSGSEFFLRDHRVHGNKVLPAVAYLEMIRAAIADAVPDRAEQTLELRNVIWAQPVVVHDRKDVSLALSVDAGGSQEQVDFEIYSDAESDEVIHCQGQALLIDGARPPRCDIEALRAQMTRGHVEATSIYSAIAGIGIDLGPAQQGIRAIHQGERQQLVEICLPETVQGARDEYVLHPSLMDSVLQAASGLFVDLTRAAGQPPVPFALESLRVFSGCQPEMFAWARFAPGSRPGDSVAKLDIDLCDSEGNVCVSMRGFSSRMLSADVETACVLAVPEWQAASAAVVDYRPVQTHVILCDIPGVAATQLEAELGKAEDRFSCREWKSARQSMASRYTEAALACFDTLRSLLQGLKERAHVQVVIAHSDLIFAGLSGLLKTATQENPNLLGQLVVTTPAVSAVELARQLREARSLPHQAAIKFADGKPEVLRWRAVEPSNAQEPSVTFKDRGVYVITGGLGGLGLIFAREILAQTTDAKVILTGRSAASDATQETLRQLSNRAFYRQLDLSDLQQVKGLFGSILQEFGRVDGIIHSAGMIADAFILKKTPDAFARVLEPKVTGTVNLDAATQDISLDFLVLFSGGAAVHGNPGQADYAAANGFMDQFAAHRNRLVAAQARHGRTLSINWPLWQDGGMTIDPEHLQALQRSTGMHPMQTQTGLRAFHECLRLQRSQVLVVEGDAERIHRAFLAEPQISAEVAERNAAAAPVDSSNLIDKTQSFLRKQFSVVLKLPAQKIDPAAPLDQYGIDSIVAMSLTNQLELTFGSLPKTLFFEYRSVRDLARHLIECHADKLAKLFAAESTDGKVEQRATNVQPTAVTSAVAQPRRQKSRKARRFRHQEQRANQAASLSVANGPIAIVGLSGRYPESIDVEAYWRNLRDGKDCITEVPEQRWSWREHYTEDRTKPGYHYSKWGGFIAGVDEFDPLFFGISPREARLMDPQERLFLQHAWMAVEDAGYTRASLQVPRTHGLPGQVGVYVGVMYGEYNLSGSLAGIANRVSSVMNFHGPSMSLDTMCSSSLTAIHLACQDLKQGRTDVAIAGGVNVSIHPSKYLMLSAGQFISSDGHCQSFGEGGDGYIPGEGVGAVVLKRLADAERDGDRIYGIIRGSALNHGGKTNGYTVPNPQAQASVIRQALTDSNTDPRHVSYIEAHGTGTKLGDPIEIAALSKAFDELGRERAQNESRSACAVGSAKSNIGHCESAAGIAGLTKVLLQMQYRQLVPSLHSARLNPHIDFERTPFVVNQALRAWEQPVCEGTPLPRIAGISSFGAGGSNAHVVVEEYVPSARTESVRGPVIIPLSARTADQLKQRARDLLDFIRAREPEGSIDLAGMAYTLQAGREAMDIRLGFIVDTVAQLAEKLEAYLSSTDIVGADIEGMCEARIRDHKETLSGFSEDPDFQDTIDRWLARKNLPKLLDVWAKGLDLNWSKLYDTPPRRVSLPTYPFAKEKYWIETVGQVVKSALQSAATAAATKPKSIQLDSAPAGGAVGTASKPKAVALIGLQELDADQATARIAMLEQVQQTDPLEQAEQAQQIAQTPRHEQTAVVEQAEQIEVIEEFELVEAIESQVDSVAVDTPIALPSLSDLQRRLSATLAEALYMDVADVDSEKSFVDLGLDSIVGVEWVKVINKHYGLSLAATRVYDYPNIKELASFVAKELAQQAAVARPVSRPIAKPVAVEKPASVPAASIAVKRTTSVAKSVATVSREQLVDRTPEPVVDSSQQTVMPPSGKIAVVGMSGRYPQADNLGQYWDNLARGRNSIVEIPNSRWRVNDYFDADPTKPGKVYCKWLGLLEDVDCFDPLFFQISPAEAQAMDPQHRLFMQEAYRAFEDAGYSNTALSNVKCGVYLGIMSNEYSLLLAKDSSINAAATGTSYAIGAARIAYHLNLKGPAIPIDTACSSSLVSIHLACQALMNREIDMALAGGVTLYLTPDSYLAMCQLGMLSKDGQCKTFDDSADGFVPGEGVGAVVLKRLEDAEADGDFIHGVILGSAINQDGKTNGITAPSVSSQIELERDLYARYRIDPETISYVETHGTGTKLGDPIELEALATVFGEKTAKQNFCALGSVKTNIGHTSGAAGVAGVQKVLLSMRHRSLAPSLNLTTENTLFDFKSSPFYVCREQQAWNAPPGSLLRAGVSSFGFSGTNAHLVLEEYVPSVKNIQQRPAAGDVAVVLSARTPAQLEQKAKDLLEFLLRAEEIDLAAVAYTLQVGRETFKERLGVVAGSVAELVEKLRGFTSGERNVEQLYRGQAGRDKDALALFSADSDLQATIGRWLEQGKFSSLLDLWVKGLDVDWRKRYAGQKAPRRIGLPTYPFAKDRYWPNVTEAAPTRASTSTVDTMASSNAALAAEKQRLIYAPRWKVEALSQSDRTARLSGPTLLLDTSDELFLALKGQLPADANLTLVRLQPGSSYEETAANRFTLDPERSAQFSELVENLSSRNQLPVQVLNNFTAADAGGFHSIFNLCKAMLANKQQSPVRVVSVHAGESGIPAARNAALAGFFKTLALENPKYRGKVVNIRTAASDPSQIARLVLDELEEQNWSVTSVSYQQARDESHRYIRSVEELVPHTSMRALPTELPLKQRGVYIVAGGLGGLGYVFSEYLAKRFGARLVLLGRSSLTAAQANKLRRLQAHQPDIAYVQADVARLDDVARAVQATKLRFGAVNGVIHAAGVNKDAFILKKTREEMNAVLSAKVLGTVNLDLATRAEPLDLFVTFSSVAATWGNAGQSDYAYGNSFMDAFAEHREELRSRLERSGRTLSIDWPFWMEGGMTLSQGDLERTQAQTGLSPLPTEEGLQLWEDILRTDLPRAVALYGDAARIGAQLTKAKTREEANPVGHAASSADLLSQAREYLQRLIGAEIKLSAEQVDPLERFDAFGIDSVVVGRLNAALARDLGELPKTLFYERENVEELAQYLASEAAGALSKFSGASVASGAPAVLPTVQLAPQETQPAASRDEQIAIIGVHGYYPGCNDLEDYWRHLRDGADLVGAVPPDRWDAEALYDSDPAKAAAGKIYCKSGAFLADVDKFDAPFFNIPPAEASVIDPQERLFLSSVWAALEDAGYTRDSLKKRFPKAKSADVGVFVGVTTNSYQLLAADEWGKGNVASASALPWSIANRVSYFFDFQGPSMPIDTACSSSLVAIHLACESLRNRECRVAIAGGVNLYLHPTKYHSLCDRRMLATEGKCRSYGAGDDGFVPGEAVGTLVLKPLSEALRDGDHVYAVIAGSAYDHSGRSNGYSAPNPNAQASVIGRALEKARIHPESISYIEGHGTGTQLGDSLEIAAVAQAFRKHTDQRQFCPVGSVKANLGHAESAAGIAGVTKVLLQMKHRQLAPSLHSDEINPNIDFEASPCYLQHGLSPWLSSNDRPRRALINSFGAGGVNACVVLEEHRAPIATDGVRATGPYLVVLSAKTPDRLAESAQQLLEHIEATDDIDLAALSFTLQVGREAMTERLALIVTNVTELKQALRGNASATVYRGTVAAGRANRKPSKVAGRDLESLAKAWSAGEEIDWDHLYAGELPKRVSLPTYPFAKERYWVSQSARHTPRAIATNETRLHPLVSHNSSTLKEVSFSSLLSATEFYARDHKVNEEMIFPGAGYLEIARAAGSIAASARVTGIKDVVWVQPLMFSTESQLVQTAFQAGDGEAQYTITSFGENNEKVVHAEGIVQFEADGAEPSMLEAHLPIESLKVQCPKRIGGASYYDQVEKSGLSYGPSFRTVQELYIGDSFALSRLRLPDELASDLDEYVLHPSIVDGALQTVSGLIGRVETSVPYLPFAIEEVQILRSTAPACYVHVEAAGAESQGNAEVRKFNLQITNEQGLVLVKISKFCVRSFKFTPAGVPLGA
ncbi:SDR family NAD(P)-dependent oxidoreductase [Peristeroidobacter agariperforans]|uniref:SDR family NAD(P)-dependent oxidoreductase n=1 Tax=Peristeroidobacter agariperforans TaxID=268404 RepID=UPI00101C943D|nr:SDR family NAD(P)-dependent oxidoreductase [Peristeroidobacter agariperforans]